MTDLPTLRVVRGDPSPEELAALLAVVSRFAASIDDDARRPSRPATGDAVGAWADRTGPTGAPVRPGPGAWRASARSLS